jgi:uncharacterized protein DUF222/HNH endonuclease
MAGNQEQVALSSIRAAISALHAASLWSRTDAQALDDARDCFALVQALESVWLSMMGDLEGRVLPGGLSTKAFLRSALRRTNGQATGDVRAATSRLTRVAKALRAGEISRAHVDVIVKTVEKIPAEVRERDVPALPEFETERGNDTGGVVTVIEAVDAFFAQRARQYDSHQLQCLARALLAALMPDDDDGFDPLAHERRQETHARDERGLVHGTFTLDAANGGDFCAAVDHFSAPQPTRAEKAEDGTQVMIADTRTPAQRRADALGLIARLAMGAAETGTKAGEPPRLVLYTGIEDYHDLHCPDPAHTAPPAPEQPAPEQPPSRRRAGRVHGATDTHLGAIGPALLARFACDAVLQTALMHPTGAILDLGRDARTITPAQRRALTARDRGCVIPGCGAPAGWSQGHHVVWWEHGGGTDLDNLVLLCGQHHTAVHLGLWTLKMIDGVPWARPSRHVDPQQRWIRNTFHDDMDQVRRLGSQARRDAPPPTTPPPHTTPAPGDDPAAPEAA